MRCRRFAHSWLGEPGRQRHQAEAQDRERQHAAEQRGVDQIVEQLIEAEPQRGRGRELGVAAADPAAREEDEGDHQHGARGADMHADRRRAACPIMTASTKKPAIRTSETRFEIVMVSRSLEAANAISAGNSSNLIASASMTQTSIDRPCGFRVRTIGAAALPNG